LRRPIAAATNTAAPHRSFSTAALCKPDDADSLAIPLSGPTVCIWGANTGVGKTIMSAGLAHAAVETGVRRFFLVFSSVFFPFGAGAPKGRPLG
jgi:hypothetical protein